MSILKQLNSGKNNKLLYYIRSCVRLALPKPLFRRRLRRALTKLDGRVDKEYILRRVEYYNKLDKVTPLPERSPQIGDLRLKGHNSAYFFDSVEYLRWFDGKLRWNYLFGDITHIPPFPAIVKSRPIKGDNANSVVLNLDKLRHFTFLKDKIEFRDKMDKSIFRGHITQKPNRRRFMEMFYGHPMCDAGIIVPTAEFPPEWAKKKITLYDHLVYKFILALEGTDVASNLKWIMSSNSIAVMPKPTYETWYMEGTLIPNYHYIEIKSDFSDLEERLNYYIQHPEEAEQIVRNANEYVSQFFDKKREKLISLLVMEKYFRMTGQKQ